MKQPNTTRIIALGFAAVILLGSVLLALPIASATEDKIGYFEALFTATSAVCVTGLVAVDTAGAFSAFGHAVILALIQTGGLGFMTMATLLFMLAGKRITLRDRLLIRESMNENGLNGMVRLIRWVMVMTLAFEGAGAVLLAFRFVPQFGWGKGIWYAVFHSVSAFCNAGFDLMGNYSSLTAYVCDPLVNFTVMALLISGGLGFGVWRDIAVCRGSFRAMKVHTRLVLAASAVMLILGGVLIAALEWTNPFTLGNMNTAQKIQAAAFQSATLRTAGFNTIDLSGMRPATKFLSGIWMFIGAAPASTGGGIKVTTAALLCLLVYSSACGKAECVIFRRTMPRELIRRAVVIALISFGVAIVSILLLAVAQPETEFIDILFEALSALGTVGVSGAGTPGFVRGAKAVLMVSMFIGRVGPLTMALALAGKQARAGEKIQYPEERVLVG